jgi:hypothetical protein
MSDYLEQSNVASDIRRLFEWDRWMIEIPSLQFPSDWKVRIIPPFGGAIIRFIAIDTKGSEVSVYLDAYDQMGSMGKKPYWEIHPDESGDCTRYWMNETAELIEGIQKSFDTRKPAPVVP